MILGGTPWFRNFNPLKKFITWHFLTQEMTTSITFSALRVFTLYSRYFPLWKDEIQLEGVCDWALQFENLETDTHTYTCNNTINKTQRFEFFSSMIYDFRPQQSFIHSRPADKISLWLDHSVIFLSQQTQITQSAPDWDWIHRGLLLPRQNASALELDHQISRGPNSWVFWSKVSMSINRIIGTEGAYLVTQSQSACSEDQFQALLPLCAKNVSLKNEAAQRFNKYLSRFLFSNSYLWQNRLANRHWKAKHKT